MVHVKVGGLLFNFKEVRTEAEEPDSCNCRNKASNYYQCVIEYTELRSLSLTSLYKQQIGPGEK